MMFLKYMFFFLVKVNIMKRKYLKIRSIVSKNVLLLNLVFFYWLNSE